MDHHPYVAIGVTAGGDGLKRETATVVPVTVVPRIAAFQNVVLATRMERTVGLLLIAVLPIEDPLIDSFLIESLLIDSFLIESLRTDNLLIVGLPLIVAPPRALLQATVFQIVAQEILARVTAGLPLIVAPQSIGSQIALQIAPPGIGPYRIVPPQTGSTTVAPLKALSQINAFPNVVLKIRAQRIAVRLLIAALQIAPTEIVERVLRSVMVREVAAVKAFQHAWTTNPVVSPVLMPLRLLPMICSGGVMPLRLL
jgi:hypothetical protein